MAVGQQNLRPLSAPPPQVTHQRDITLVCVWECVCVCLGVWVCACDKETLTNEVMIAMDSHGP